ncbi:MAG: sulfatase [Beijerinckiaceae bacterium]
MAKRPNFLLIITDQHRADHLGCYGNKIVKTPSIDSLAGRGIRFDRNYVANPICSPNRASIMTGRLPSLHGVRHNGIALSREHTTFVEVLRGAGYKTAIVGKSHLQAMTGMPATLTFKVEEGLAPPPEGMRDAYKDPRGGPLYELEVLPKWDTPLSSRMGEHFYGFEHVEIADDHADRAGGDYLLWARSQHPDFDSLVGPENATPDNRINAPQAWRTKVPEELYSTSWIGQRTIDFLETQAKSDEPFFIQMSFPDPHHPFTPPGKYWDMYDPADMPLPRSYHNDDLPPIKAMQEAFKAGADPRDNQNPFAVTEQEVKDIIALTYGSITMIDDTIGRVLAALKRFGLDEDTVVIFTSDHGDYMGDHGIMLKLLLHYQGLIRTPLIWSEAGMSAASNGSLTNTLDLSASILRRAGIQPFNGNQGRDVLAPEAEGPDCLIVEEDSQRPMLGFPRPQRLRTLVTKRWRMTIRTGEDWSELYDLENDPDENVNLWDDPGHAKVRSELHEMLLRKTIDMQDRAPLPAYRA